MDVSLPDRSSRLCILIADDEAGIRELVKRWLIREGHEVDCAASGAEAMRLLRSRRFDLVITDIMMPDGDGFELIGGFRKLQPTARILAISGGGKYLQGADCLKIARGLGAHALVMKPFKWPQLLTGIADAIPSYRTALVS